jgi:putative xylitol transport system ATP-binding protein
VTALLKVEGLKKSFGGVHALRNGQFELQSGSVHALCGGNGAGKSTFLLILMGIIRGEDCTIWRNGKEVVFATPAEALASGIAIIEQELSPIPNMTVAENIFLGREPSGRFGGIDFRKMNAAAQAILDDLGFAIPANRMMVSLSVAQAQLVEIAKALSHDAEVIFMDEPTSAIGEREALQLFAVIEKLKSQGRGIVYVSHRLSEIFGVADHYTVFRDGAYVASGPLAGVDRASLIRMIVGREITEEYVKVNTPTKEEGLTVAGLTSPGKITDISFAARKGEIFGIYGLMGSGRSEILESLFGLDPASHGVVTLFGEPISVASPAEAKDRGIAFVTEDRKLAGRNLNDTIRNNICVASLRELSPNFIMDSAREARSSRETIERFRVRVGRDLDSVSSLSGGNQQKIVLGKWFLRNPHVLLLDEPTRGVDVGAKREISRIVGDFAAAGGVVVMISSEIDEILGVADRVMVMRDGRSAGILDRSEATAEKLVHLSTQRKDGTSRSDRHRFRTKFAKTSERHVEACRTRVRHLRRFRHPRRGADFANKFFLTQSNIANVLLQTSINGVLAIGMTFVIITRGIDLSVGSVLALAGIVSASFATTSPVAGIYGGPYPLVVALVVGLLIGVATGGTIGIIVAGFRVPAFVASLGMLSAARGLTLIFAGGRPVPALTPEYRWIGTGDVFGVPAPVAILAVVFALSWFVLSRTRFGRYIYAVGGDPRAAKTSGIDVVRIRFAAYVICGALAALAGMLLAARAGSALTQAGIGYELDAIAAVVIGGVSLSGGVGRVTGTLVGALIIGVMNNGLDLMGIESYYQQVLKGMLIVGAVLLDQRGNRGE